MPDVENPDLDGHLILLESDGQIVRPGRQQKTTINLQFRPQRRYAIQFLGAYDPDGLFIRVELSKINVLDELSVRVDPV